MRTKVPDKENAIVWRKGMDNTVHAIVGCDPMASAWIAICGVLITGKKETPDNFRCPKCRQQTEL